jgi:AcrR family transcriptional regulator
MPTRELTGERAQAIVDAMRSSVGLRGAAGSTFDHVAREAGVSRGLLHYYFGTKERLLVEVCRRDCDIRMAVLDEALAPTRTADELVAALVGSLQDLLREDPGFIALVFELFTTSRHNPELASEVAEIVRRTREHVAELLEAKQAEGVIALGAPAEAVATVLFSLADGLAMRMLAQPAHDYEATIQAGVVAIAPLIRNPV